MNAHFYCKRKVISNKTICASLLCILMYFEGAWKASSLTLDRNVANWSFFTMSGINWDTLRYQQNKIWPNAVKIWSCQIHWALFSHDSFSEATPHQPRCVVNELQHVEKSCLGREVTDPSCGCQFQCPNHRFSFYIPGWNHSQDVLIIRECFFFLSHTHVKSSKDFQRSIVLGVCKCEPDSWFETYASNWTIPEKRGEHKAFSRP